MEITLSYRTKTEKVKVPSSNLLGILNPNTPSPFHDTERELKNAAESAIDFLGSAHRVLVLVNDYTRPTPNQPILKLLQPELKNRDAKFFVALGTHRPAKETELKTIFGEALFAQLKDRIFQHTYKDRASLFFLGKTSFGTNVELNRQLLWAERVITINSIEPHYFAGYTGGRKCFIPGIAGHDTICHNHNLLLHPASAPLSLKDNPVHEDMTEAAKMVPKPVFSIQFVQDQNHNLLSVYYGDLFDSFIRACGDAYQVYALPIKQRADIVLSVLQPPYDINFYQAQRAVEFALPALRPGGIQITVSVCYDGLGDTGFIQVMQQCSRPQDLLKMAPPSHLGWYKAARLAKILENFSLYTVMEIDEAVISSVFMHPFCSIQEAIDAGYKQLGKEATVYIIPDAGSVVPVFAPTGDPRSSEHGAWKV